MQLIKNGAVLLPGKMQKKHVKWMRIGRWSKTIDYGEGSSENPGFPKQPDWFSDNRDFKNIEKGLADVGFDKGEIEAVMGRNWYNFYTDNFLGLD